MIPGTCSKTLTGIHKPHKKVASWCTACGQGRPIDQKAATRAVEADTPIDALPTYHAPGEEPDPEERWHECPADPTGHGLGWRNIEDPDDWCRACGAGGAPVAREDQHAALAFVLTKRDQEEARRAQRREDRVAFERRQKEERAARMRQAARKRLQQAAYDSVKEPARNEEPETLNARSTDPETSKAAARNGNWKRASIPRKIAGFVVLNPGHTRSEIAEGIGLTDAQVWRRVSDLVRDGWLYYGEERMAAYGEEQKTVYPTEALMARVDRSKLPRRP